MGTTELRNSYTFHVRPMYNWNITCSIKTKKCVLRMPVHTHTLK